MMAGGMPLADSVVPYYTHVESHAAMVVRRKRNVEGAHRQAQARGAGARLMICWRRIGGA